MLNPSKMMVVVALSCYAGGGAFAEGEPTKNPSRLENLKKGLTNLPKKAIEPVEKWVDWEKFKKEPWPCKNMETCSLRTVCDQAPFNGYKNCKSFAAKRWGHKYVLSNQTRFDNVEVDFSAFMPQDEDDLVMLLNALPTKPFLGEDPIHYRATFSFLTKDILDVWRKKNHVTWLIPTILRPIFDSKVPLDGLSGLEIHLDDKAQFENIDWESVLKGVSTITKSQDGWEMSGSGKYIKFKDPSLFDKALERLKGLKAQKAYDVNFSGANFTQSQIRGLTEWTQGLSINKLDLSNNQLVDAEVDALIETLPNLQVKRINLEKNAFSEVGKNKLLPVLKEKQAAQGTTFSI